MSMFSFFFVILPIFRLIESKECLKAGKMTTLTFVHYPRSSSDEAHTRDISSDAEILLQSPTDEMYISVNNQVNALRILFKQCLPWDKNRIACPIESLLRQSPLDTEVVMLNTTNEGCKFKIGKVNHRLKSILHLSSSHVNPPESNRTPSEGSSSNKRRYDEDDDDDDDDRSTMRKLIISLSILGFFTCLLFTGLLVCYLNRRIRIRRIRNQRKKAGIYSIRQPLEQFPVMIFMAKDQKHDFPNEIHPRCGICFEQFCDHTRVRKLKCLHYFHVLCLSSWVLTHEKCPICSRHIFDNAVPTVSADIPIFPDESTDTSYVY